MRRSRLLPLALLSAWGCQGESLRPPAETVAPVVIKVGAPNTTTPTDIALVRGRAGVTVGMRADDAFKAFRDAKDGGFEYEKLPPGFGSPYRARSWEAGPRGFGVITYEDRIVAAMLQERRTTFERALELVQSHQDRLMRPADKVVAGKHVNYWFWEEDGQRLMILAVQKGGANGAEITAAMGDDIVMDALGASVPKAEAAYPQVDRALEKRTSEETLPKS